MIYCLPQGFVYLADIDPSIFQDIRYFSTNNFLGQKVQGYEAPVCITTEIIARNLKNVQEELRSQGFSLLVFDAYRPQQAVNHFVEWAKDIADQRCKKEYYPQIDKKDVFKLGYIAERSAHTRGAAVDLTIIKTYEDQAPEELNMGTPFDFLGELSHTLNPLIQGQKRKNRLFLKDIMERNGFVNYAKEWWHFNIKEEPFPDTYFDFPIRDLGLSKQVSG